MSPQSIEYKFSIFSIAHVNKAPNANAVAENAAYT